MSKTRIRNARRGVQEKYLVFLVNLRDQMNKDRFVSVSAVAKNHMVPFDLVPSLMDLGIICGSRAEGRTWIGPEPTYRMVRSMRIACKKNRAEKKPNEDKFYDVNRATFEKKNPEATRVGYGYYQKSNRRRWNAIASWRIFNLKMKIYKLQ